MAERRNNATSVIVAFVGWKVGAVALVLAALTGTAIMVVLVATLTGGTGGTAAVSAAACAPPAQALAGTPQAPTVLLAQQVANAKAIDAATRAVGMPGYAARLAIVTAMNESSLINVGHGDRDSQGLFQQRPSQGWGTIAQITNPTHAATSFLIGPKHDRHGGLIAVAGWEAMQPDAAIYAVQRSATRAPTADDHDPAQAIIKAAGLDLSYTWAAGASPAEIAAGKGTLGGTGTVAVGNAVTACAGVVAAGAVDSAGVPQFPSQAGCTDTAPLMTTPNGQMPTAQLCPALSSRFLLQPAAANALAAMNTAYWRDTGSTLCILDGYRSFADQVFMKAKRGSWAATPGTSNHGLGLAVDLCGSISWSGTTYAWLAKNSTRFGWIHSAAMSQSSSLPEPWHWEFATYLPNIVPYFPKGTPSQYPMLPIEGTAKTAVPPA